MRITPRFLAMPLLIGLSIELGLASSVPAEALNHQDRSQASSVVAAPPPGCIARSGRFGSTPGRPIPDSPAVISDSILVSGVNAVLWDLNLSTVISHTNSADLDITLQSPAGTIVTVSTDNGGATDDAFAGTLWDDSANPGGQLPYAANSGMVTDHAYSNMAASTLTPEEPFAAFAGENPNGVWLLTISDDQASGTGNLVSWTLDVTTIFRAPTPVATVQATSAERILISASGSPLVSSTLTLTPAGFLTRITATTVISHTFSSDLDVTLTSPGGIVVTLTTDNASSFDDVFTGTVWDVDADPGSQVPYSGNPRLVADHVYLNRVIVTPLSPEESLGAFWGSNPAGDWVLTVHDDLSGFGGSLEGWSLNVTVGDCPIFIPTDEIYLPLTIKQ